MTMPTHAQANRFGVMSARVMHARVLMYLCSLVQLAGFGLLILGTTLYLLAHEENKRAQQAALQQQQAQSTSTTYGALAHDGGGGTAAP